MSLIGHWKLDGDAKDSSMNNHGSINGSPSVVNGKIGDCYEFDGSDDYIDCGNSEIYNIVGSLTLSCWAYANSNGWTRLIMRDDHNQWQIDISDDGEYRFILYDEDGDEIDRVYSNDSDMLDEWYHIVGLYDKERGKVEIYINGEKQNDTANYSGQLKSNSDAPLNIGRDTDGDNHFDGKIDDVRIYDHALSVKEIKELSRVKVLHYRFDNFAEPTENLISPNPDDWNEASGAEIEKLDDYKMKVTNPDNGTWGRAESEQITVEDGETITASAYIVETEPTSEVTFQIRDKTNSTSVKIKEFVEEDFNGEVELIWENDKGESIDCTIWLAVYGDREENDGQQYIVVDKVQIEQKDHATPFTEDTREDRVTDSSGYDNHAELDLSDTPKWVEDSALGKGAYEFDGDSQYFVYEHNSYLDIKDEISVCTWIKGDTEQDKHDYPRSLCRETNNVFDLFHNSGSIRFRINGDDYVSDSLNGEWQFIVGTYNKNNVKLYVDGELKDEKSQTDDIEITDNPLIVGARSDSGTDPFEGDIDDVRIYATALSEDEVKELYKQRGSIDSKGNLYGHNIQEPDERVLIKEQTKNVYDNDYKSIGTWSVEETDVSTFVEDDNTLGNTIVEGWVHCTSSEYYLTTIEYTKDNNTKGFKKSIPDPDDGWKEGWNYINFDVSNYKDEDNTPWYNMDRLEFYRSGDDNDVDDSQEITIKDLKLRKFIDNQEIKFNIDKKGRGRVLNFSEVGITDGLVGYWKLNGNTKDYSGEGNHGDNNGASITSGLGQNAYEFDGSDDYIDIDDSSLTEDYPFGKNNSNMSIFLWVYSLDFSTDETNHDTRNNIFGNAGSFDDNFELGLYDDTIDVYTEVDSTDTTLHVDTSISTNNWYLIGVTKSSSDGLKVYKNNNLIETDSSQTGTFEVSSGNDFNLTIGKSGNTETYFDGKIQDVRIYNRALSEREVKILYNITNPDNKQKVIQSNSGVLYTKGQIKENL